MSKQKIVVTGANGQLGRTLQALATSIHSYDFIFLTKEQLPLDHFDEVQHFLESERPDFCINCAAYTAVDKAEKDRDLAFLINGESTGVLASVCSSFNIKLIHISTDYVFDGDSSIALKEEDPTAPLNLYGASKRMGEELALKNNQDSIILRTSWLYAEFGNNFVNTMIRLMKERESINVVDDQVGSPTYAGDLGKVILEIIASGKFIPGIYHYSNEGRISWYEFALAIKEMIHSNCQVNPIPSTEYPMPAKRPRFSLLDKTKIKRVYGIKIPDWKSSLADCIKKEKKKERNK